jgi:hypothetical protein
MGLLETIAMIIFFIFGMLGLIIIVGGYLAEQPVSVNVTVTPTDAFKDEKNIAVKFGDTLVNKTVNIVNGAIAGANK